MDDKLEQGDGTLAEAFFQDPGFSVDRLSDGEFARLLACLWRAYGSRVFNCVDPTGRHDREWSRLAGVFFRAAKALEAGGVQ